MPYRRDTRGYCTLSAAVSVAANLHCISIDQGELGWLERICVVITGMHRMAAEGMKISIDHFVVIRRIPRLYLENHKRFAGILMAKV